VLLGFKPVSAYGLLVVTTLVPLATGNEPKPYEISKLVADDVQLKSADVDVMLVAARACGAGQVTGKQLGIKLPTVDPVDAEVKLLPDNTIFP
jgi:hypothetical protein